MGKYQQTGVSSLVVKIALVCMHELRAEVSEPEARP